MPSRNYSTPNDFKAAIEHRIRQRADATGRLHNDIRQRVLFERALERIYAKLGRDVLILKGGLALELRIDRARTTRDIDVQITGDVEDAVRRIRLALSPALEAKRQAQPADQRPHPDSFLVFVVRSEKPLSLIKSYPGTRVTVQATIGSKPFGAPFHIDIATGDILVHPAETLTKTSFFDFIGVAPVEHRLYPLPAHLAEKLHSLTLPRSYENSRLKDLVDVALLLELDPPTEQLQDAVGATFKHRATHPIPKALPEPPPSWRTRYPRERARAFPWLPWTTLAELETIVRQNIDPVLNAVQEHGERRPSTEEA